ncbi:glycosyltransferase [Altericroceibacterium spongiae]|uniref:Glycosyltransferase n=2 Tax=Altericroceibacterium spongiae TaxID=2320269 RepID=A0A420ELX9_9SPHN|nr:glycosyltransferase [Altericroceibacterium spongiae]
MEADGRLKDVRLPDSTACRLSSFRSHSLSLEAPRIALIGNYPPRRCGIATFTGDVHEKLTRFHPEVSVDLYALEDPDRPLKYPPIAGTISRADPQSYLQAAQRINRSAVDVVWLQHEYGIFGGTYGDMVCDFVDMLAAPLILTPHTVLADPDPKQRAILEHLIARSSRIMVMSAYSRDLLAESYGAPHELLDIVHHGAPYRPFGRQAEFKARLGLSDRNVLMTFGLLSPGKGLELVIEALPEIVRQHPRTIYRIVGATHPHLLASEGEAYREKLLLLAEELGVSGHIEWDARFLDTDELLDQLEACDIYLTPYLNLQQSTSGTLSYAVALGKAVIATPYLHARELLTDGVGCLVEPDSASAIMHTVCHLLDNPEELQSLQRRAYERGRETIWPRFADKTVKVIESAIAHRKETATSDATHPGLSGVFAMCDSVGILQHATGIVPERAHGYCLDDNARALMLMNVTNGLSRDDRMRRSLTFASFLQDAWNEETNHFRNFMGFDRCWAEAQGSDDSNGRALRALGHTLRHSTDPGLRRWAKRLYDTALPLTMTLDCPRATAFAMLGAVDTLHILPDHGASYDLLSEGASFLHRLLDVSRRPDWAWFETVLGYDNPRLSEALIEAGLILENKDFIEAGVESLLWISKQQVSENGWFSPVGSDSFSKPYRHLPFDQQPLEALAAIEAAKSGYAATANSSWLDHANKAWSWFFGANDRGVSLADLTTGRCRDGINPRGANENCGAESILAFQLSYYAMAAMPEER